jgi:hypothetical protein
MSEATVITNDGKNNVLELAFANTAIAGVQFGYMALGKMQGVYDPTSTSLGEECGAGDGDYQRVDIVPVLNPTDNTISLSGTFDMTNITNATTITEVGIVTQPTGSSVGDIWFCLSQTPQTIKDGTASLTVTLNLQVDE